MLYTCLLCSVLTNKVIITCFLLRKQVNILMHTDEVELKAERITAIEKKKESLRKDGKNLHVLRPDHDDDTSIALSESTEVPRSRGLENGSSIKQPAPNVAVMDQGGVHTDMVADEAEGNLSLSNGQSPNQSDAHNMDITFSKGETDHSICTINGGEEMGNGFGREDKCKSSHGVGSSESSDCQRRSRRRDACSSSATGEINETSMETNKFTISIEPKDDHPFVEGNQTEGGALWDIFRREDVSKLHDYLMKHAEEFRHYNYETVKQVISYSTTCPWNAICHVSHLTQLPYVVRFLILFTINAFI